MRFLLIILYLIISSSAVLADKNSKQVTVTADKVNVEDNSSVSVYSGNAKANWGETYLTADTIKIIHPDQKPKSIYIVGKPAFVSYMAPDKKNKIKGSANAMEYNLKTETLIMKGQAKIINGKNKIRAEEIRINKKTGEMHATSSKKSQVRIVFEINE